MGVPTSEVGYASATTERGDHEVHKGHVVTLAQKHWSSRKVLLLSDFNETWILWRGFRRIYKYNFLRKCVEWEPGFSMRKDGQTEMSKLIAAFSDFTIVPKNDNRKIHGVFVKCDFSIIVTAFYFETKKRNLRNRRQKPSTVVKFTKKDRFKLHEFLE
jgi:hypothetical protein